MRNQSPVQQPQPMGTLLLEQIRLRAELQETLIYTGLLACQ